MVGGVEQLDEGCELRLNLLKRRQLLKLGIRQAQLNLELGLNEILPCLPLLNIAWFNLLQAGQNSFIRLRREDQPIIGDNAIGTAIFG
jgi:hypothetical protein